MVGAPDSPTQRGGLAKAVDVLQTQVQRLDITLVRMYRALQEVEEAFGKIPRLLDAEKFNAEALSQVLAIRAQIAKLETIPTKTAQSRPSPPRKAKDIIELPSPPGSRSVSRSPRGEATPGLSRGRSSRGAATPRWDAESPTPSSRPCRAAEEGEDGEELNGAVDENAAAPSSSRAAVAPLSPVSTVRVATPLRTVFSQAPWTQVTVSQPSLSQVLPQVPLSKLAVPLVAVPQVVTMSSRTAVRGRSPGPVESGSVSRSRSCSTSFVPVQTCATVIASSPSRPRSQSPAMALGPPIGLTTTPLVTAPLRVTQALPSPILAPAVAYGTPTLSTAAIPSASRSSPFRSSYDWRDLYGEDGNG